MSQQIIQLLDNISLDDDFELEFRIPLNNSIKSILDYIVKDPNSKRISSSDELISYYQPVVTIPNTIFRSIEPTQSGRTYSIKYERKELISKKYHDNLETPFGKMTMICKYSHEIPSDEFKNMSIDHSTRKIRISFTNRSINYRIDITARITSVKSEYNKFVDVREIEIQPDDILEMNLRHKGINIVYDIEFEQLESKTITQDYKKLIEYLTKTNMDLISSLPFDITRTPQVSVLTNEIINRIDSVKHEYVWLDKTDGLRTLIVIDSNSIYTYRSTEGLIKLSDLTNSDFGSQQLSDSTIIDSLSNVKSLVSSTKPRIVIFDSEFFEDRYYIFDCYYLNKDVRHYSFDERLETIQSWLKSKPSESILKNMFSVKSFHQIQDWNELINYATTRRNGVDGVVIQSLKELSIDNQTWFKETISYKLKPVELNTTDFLLKRIKGFNKYQLYLTGRANDIIFNMRMKSRVDKLSQDMFNTKYSKLDFHQIYNILFTSPYFEGVHSFTPDSNDQTDYNNKIVEMSPSIKEVFNKNKTSSIRVFDKWTPLRIRTDKIHSNGYYTGLSNSGIIFSPIHPPNESYFEQINIDESNQELINSFHTINQYIRTFNYDMLSIKLEGMSKSLTAIDIGGGRGSDVNRLYELGVTKLFAVDSDYDALVKYTNKIRFVKRYPVDHVINGINSKGHGSLLFNSIGFKLSNDNSLLLNELLNRDEFKLHCCNVVVINYIIHYLCEPDKYESNLRELIRLIDKCINKDSLIMITYFDGDEIIKHKGKFDPFNIKIESNHNFAMMPLPTISKDGYRREPLVHDSYIDLFREHYEVVDEFNPMNDGRVRSKLNCKMTTDKNENQSQENYEKLYNYLSTIKTIILKFK